MEIGYEIKKSSIRYLPFVGRRARQGPLFFGEELRAKSSRYIELFTQELC